MILRNITLINPVHAVRSLPNLPPKLSHGGEIQSNPTLLGEPLDTSKQIREARKIKIDDQLGDRVLVTRGQSTQEYHNGQVPKNRVKVKVPAYYNNDYEHNAEIAAHQQGTNQFISASIFLPVSKLYAGIESIKSPCTAAQFSFDLRMLKDSYQYTMSRPHIDNVWEGETSIMKAIPEAATLGYRRYAFGLGLGRFIYNELYIDPNLCTKDFIENYEKYREVYEEIIWNNINGRKIDFSNNPADLIKFIELNVELYKNYNMVIKGNLEFIQETNGKKQGINIDEIANHFKEKYAITPPALESNATKTIK